MLKSRKMGCKYSFKSPKLWHLLQIWEMFLLLGPCLTKKSPSFSKSSSIVQKEILKLTTKTIICATCPAAHAQRDWNWGFCKGRLVGLMLKGFSIKSELTLNPKNQIKPSSIIIKCIGGCFEHCTTSSLRNCILQNLHNKGSFFTLFIFPDLGWWMMMVDDEYGLITMIERPKPLCSSFKMTLASLKPQMCQTATNELISL